MVLASGSEIVDAMTKHEHATGQWANAAGLRSHPHQPVAHQADPEVYR
jgi:hypothetical protein